MNTFSINTLGCKVNQYESQQIRELLESAGLYQVDLEDGPDLVIVNSCCVTQTASAKSRQFIHKAQKLSPHGQIILCGCLPRVKLGELGNLGKGVQVIKHRQNLATTLKQIVSNSSQINESTGIRTQNGSKIKDKESFNVSNLPHLTKFKGHIRAFLKVQDGCDSYCSYCIIPKTRPEIYSVGLETAVYESERLVRAGHKEIVITGIFLGAYGLSTTRKRKWANKENTKFINLVEKISEVNGLERVRLSSLEPGDVSEGLLDVFCKNRNIMPHLHLSLQSGCDSVLKKMCRQYRSGEFMEKVSMLRERLDRPALTTDIIVGFPGETDKDFEESFKLAEKAEFSKIHVFSFSARKNTAAVKLSKLFGPIKPSVIKERSAELRRLNDKLESRFREQFIGEFANVLVEKVSKGYAYGRAERYFMVKIKNVNNKIKQNDIVKVKISGNEKNNVSGELVDIIG